MVYKEQIIDCLREFSDEAIQRKRWLSSSGPEVSSFTEAICQLFDDTGLGDELEKNTTVFNREIDCKLRLLLETLKSIDSSLSPNSLIEDPKMLDIRESATTIINDIRESERRK
jgi:hypothetical protein